MFLEYMSGCLLEFLLTLKPTKVQKEKERRSKKSRKKRSRVGTNRK